MDHYDIFIKFFLCNVSLQVTRYTLWIVLTEELTHIKGNIHIPDLDEKLMALGQVQEDHLPAKIRKSRMPRAMKNFLTLIQRKSRLL